MNDEEKIAYYTEKFRQLIRDYGSAVEYVDRLAAIEEMFGSAAPAFADALDVAEKTPEVATALEGWNL